MRVLEINSVPYGSTGNIMVGISELCEKNGIEVTTASGYSTHPMDNLPETHMLIGSAQDKLLHILFAKVTGYNGCFSRMETKRFLEILERERFDLIHFHNLHGWYINLPLLFRYIRKVNIPVVWTFHDCWAFTGQCPHFSYPECDRWMDGCHHCKRYREYPSSLVDNTKKMWTLKKQWFTGVRNLTIVTPSAWLAGLTKRSFMGYAPVRVIPNGIDLSVFFPTQGDFKQRYGVSGKKIVLGVAFDWSVRKGIDVFLALAERLDPNYQIVLVGTDEKIDKQLPANILPIHRTQNQRELAEIYSAADVFVNPTREDNFPTVNMEALACGTPVVTFPTGGSPESIDDTCGSVVETDDTEEVAKEIVRICRDRPYSVESCRSKAVQFDKNYRFQEYVNLFKEIYDTTSEHRT